MKTSPNKTRRLLAAALAVALAAPLAPATAAGGLFGEQVQGNGSVRKQQRQVANFTGVSLAVPGDVELMIGNSESLVIEADENLLPLIETQVRNGMLRIEPTRKNLELRSRDIRIVVTARAVDRLQVGGSGTISSDALRAQRLELVMGGSGAINVKSAEADTLSATLGGSGDLKVGGGNARSLSVSIGGSGDVDLGRVRAASANVNIAGSGTATVWAQDSLNMTVAGSGDVNYYGDPKISRTVLGSGDARRLGAAPR